MGRRGRSHVVNSLDEVGFRRVRLSLFVVVCTRNSREEPCGCVGLKRIESILAVSIGLAWQSKEERCLCLAARENPSLSAPHRTVVVERNIATGFCDSRRGRSARGTAVGRG